jgi:3D (Asp-Asp-Asp) domain-containing protein
VLRALFLFQIINIIMSKPVKIIYPVIALILMAVPISAAAAFPNFAPDQVSPQSVWSFLQKQYSGSSFYDKLTSVLEKFAAEKIFRNADQEVPKEPQYTVKTTKKILVTAYSSTPDQTDNTPFLTANGSFVKDGVMACNFLAFGTKVRLPEIYGDKVFVVADRMAPQNYHKADIWMESRTQALEFGVKIAKIEILN